MFKRGSSLVILFASAALRWWRNAACRQTPVNLHARALWLQQEAKHLLQTLHIEVQWQGDTPDQGILLSNHLGYLDILVLGSKSPATFVAKKDILRWPVIGRLVNMAGTIWVSRTSRQNVHPTLASMQQAINLGQLVVLFPEGTSSDGTQVLPFKPSLLQAATTRDHVWITHLRYELTDGNPGTEVAYWGDASFFPHLLNLLKKKRIKAFVHCKRIPVPSTDRKQLAPQLRDAIQQLGSTS